MWERVNDLVETSMRDAHYDKAIKCIQALRQGCQQEDEWQRFNQGNFFLDVIDKLKKNCCVPQSIPVFGYDWKKSVVILFCFFEDIFRSPFCG